MIKYRLDLSDEKKEAAIQIALESEGNVRKRKRAVPAMLILGTLLIFDSLFQFINSSAFLGVIFMAVGIVSLLVGLKAKSFQKFVLKKAELLLDKSFRAGIIDYVFDDEGIKIASQIGYAKYYWPAFKEYGTMGQYIYVKRKDNKLILVDKNDLSKDEMEELMRLLTENNIKHKA